MLRKNNIICFGFAEWDNPYRTNQHHLMEMFSKENRVLFIESLGLRRPTAQVKDIRRIFFRLAKWIKGVRRVNDNLFVYSPLVLPFHKYALVRDLNRRLLRSQLSRLVKKLKLDKPILWSYVPNAVDYIGAWGERISVYHCVDDLSANPLIPKEAVKGMESRFLEKVDVVFATAKKLYEEKRKQNAHTYYMPNVADFRHFNRATLPETAVPADIAGKKSPLVGFIGAISGYKLDFELLGILASRHPEWSIVMIGAKGEGEKAADTGDLEKHSNISLLGGKPYGSLPGYLKGFDVCLLPNLMNEYTENMFPMKFFEYLAAGKPVIAMNLPALGEFKDYCYLSTGHDEFENNILKALSEDNEQLRKKRVALAGTYTWDHRVEEMSAAIERRLSEKNDAVK